MPIFNHGLPIKANVIQGEGGTDTSQDTVTPETLLEGVTAHNAAGEPIVGTCDYNANTENDTVTAEKMLEGITAHDAAGQEITGTIPNYDGANIDGIYEQLEYIESPYDGDSGTAAYIDTGVLPSETLSFDVTFSIPLHPTQYGYGNVFGARLSSGVQEYQLTQNAGGSISVGIREPISFASETIHRITFDGGCTVTIDGIPHTIRTSSFADQDTIGTIVLFAIRESGNVTQCEHARIYRLRFGNVRDFIPVLDMNNVPCLYDRVTKNIFYNAGAGQFLYQKKQTTESTLEG